MKPGRVLLVLAILPLVVSRGRGHGGTPLSTGVFFDEDRLLIATRYWGLFAGAEAGPWRWICDEAIATDPTPNPNRSWARAGSGSLHASDFRGVISSRDRGCTWVPSSGELALRPTAQVVADPIDPHAAWAVTYASQSDDNALYRTGDDGLTWSPIFRTDAYLNSVAVSGDGQTLYVGGVERVGAAPVLYLSHDRGQSFSRITPAYRLDGMPPVTLRVLSVDPADGSVVWLAAARDPKRALVRATAEGTQYQEQFQVSGEIFNLAFDRSRATVWAATQAGLRRSIAGAPFAPAGDLTQTQCVSMRGAAIYACSSNFQPDLKVLARSDDGGDHFTGIFQFSQAAGPIETCPAGTPVATLCPPLWDLYAERLGVPAGPDLGSGASDPLAPAGCSMAREGPRMDHSLVLAADRSRLRCGCASGAHVRRVRCAPILAAPHHPGASATIIDRSIHSRVLSPLASLPPVAVALARPACFLGPFQVTQLPSNSPPAELLADGARR